MPPSDILVLSSQFAFNASLFDLSLEGLDDERAGRRMRSGQGSSATFLAGHLLASRAQILAELGSAVEDPWKEMFAGSAPARDGASYPPLEELRIAWRDLNVTLLAALSRIGPARANASGPDWLPLEDKTVRGLLQFFAWHESYHLGQLGLLRTELGLASIQTLFQARLAAAS